MDISSLLILASVSLYSTGSVIKAVMEEKSSIGLSSCATTAIIMTCLAFHTHWWNSGIALIEAINHLLVIIES